MALNPPTPPNAEEYLFPVPHDQILLGFQATGILTAGLANNTRHPEIILTRTLTIGNLDRFCQKHVQTVTRVIVDSSGDIHVYGVAI